jgi:UDP-N-acetylglucosamine--N-acetylmuramyl-(pentapeptide) pyrophosphoryl-undecaprenol N-acetylglucosamine transferase
VQTGERDLPLVRERIRKTALRVEACAFITEMGEAYAVADLGVSRAGANTIAELVARSVPALLVPYPHAAHGHQEANARSLERLGAAEVILDRELTGSLLADRIRALLQDEARCARMRSESTRTDHARASQRIVEAVLRLGGEPAGSQ